MIGCAYDMIGGGPGLSPAGLALHVSLNSTSSSASTSGGGCSVNSGAARGKGF